MADSQPTDFFADPPAGSPLGAESWETPGVADAATDPSAAGNAEGAPLPDAPDEEAAPDAGDDGEGEETPIDWQARAEAAEQRAGDLAQRQAQYDAAQQAALYRQAQEAFDANWQEHVAYAEENLSATEAARYLSQVRDAHVAALRQYYEGAVQTVMRVAMGPGYAEHLIAEHGLAPEDRALLGNDPQQMPVIAAALAARDRRTQTQIDQTKRDLRNVKRGQQARRLVASGATLAGGPGQRAPVVDPRSLSPMEHLKALLAGQIREG